MLDGACLFREKMSSGPPSKRLKRSCLSFAAKKNCCLQMRFLGSKYARNAFAADCPLPLHQLDFINVLGRRSI